MAHVRRSLHLNMVVVVVVVVVVVSGSYVVSGNYKTDPIEKTMQLGL